jgi:MoaA/NifB/PqqE/SkfB family radical SAM enzyme
MYDLAEIEMLHFEPTTLCNAGCPQCARYEDDGTVNPRLPQVTVTLAQVRDWLPESFLKRLKKIVVCGTFGDPAACAELPQMLRYFTSVNPEVTIGLNSNGGLRSAQWWSRLASTLRPGQDCCTFSIDGLSDTNHIYRRGVRWRRLEDNLRAFIEAGGDAHWEMLVFEHNQHQVEAAQELARSMGFRWFRAKVSMRFTTRPIQWLKPPSTLRTDMVDETALSSEILCSAKQNREIYLSAHGLVSPCCHFSQQLYEPNTQDRTQDLLQFMGDVGDWHVQRGIQNVHARFGDIERRWQHQPLKVCHYRCSTIGQQPRWASQWIIDQEL